MNKYVVLKTFRDKNTKEKHEKGSVYEANEKRAAELQKKGFLGEQVQEQPQTPADEKEGNKGEAKKEAKKAKSK